jgi:type II secretory pathway component PulF
MRKLVMLLAMLLAAGTFLGLAFGAGARQAEESSRKGAETQSKASAEKPFPVGAEFTETLEDWQLINAEIARIEKAEGTVEIPVSIEKLRQRAAVKTARLNKWIQDHGVAGWNYDARLARFEPPSSPAGSGAPGAATPGARP